MVIKKYVHTNNELACILERVLYIVYIKQIEVLWETQSSLAFQLKMPSRQSISLRIRENDIEHFLCAKHIRSKSFTYEAVAKALKRKLLLLSPILKIDAAVNIGMHVPF